MSWAFPAEPQEKRRVLLDAVEEVRDVLTAGAEEAEAAGTLPAATVDALYESGLLALKLPQVMGGAEADLLTQLDVLEAVTRIDASAGWCLLIGSASVGGLGAFLPDEAIDEVFAGGRPPKTCGVAMASGKAVPVDGGYRVSGRWSFASGIRHCQWVSAGAMVDRGSDAAPERLTFTVKTSEVEIHDNWHVAGLQGTGSNDFSVSDLFVRKAFTRDPASTSPQRGGPLYRMGRPGSVSNEHCAFALGLGRRALDEMRDLGQAYRGYSGTSSIASRSLFQRSLGECDLKLRGARALVVDILEEAWRVVCGGHTPEPWLQAELRTAGTFSTDVAVEVASKAFRFGGGRALQNSNILQRCLRDINAAAQHLMVNDSTYENHGQFILGLPDADPMG